MEALVIKLFDVKAVKFGHFMLKSGIMSPVYFDLRVIISYPDLMKLVSHHLWRTVQAAGIHYDSVCGVPYTALPIATCISAEHDIPMLIRRKEAKDYGTKKLIEGEYSAGDTCLIVEDVVTSGSSVLETAESLNSANIVVNDAVVLLDRCQGGKQRLKDRGINLHSVLSVDELLTILVKAGKLSPAAVIDVKEFIAANSTYSSAVVEKPKRYTYSERAALCHNPLSQRIFSIMDSKKTNLALSADVTTSQQLLSLADLLGPYICVLKTHIDIMQDFSMDVITELRKIADKHNFIIFEDRKFADIGNTVKHQLSGGIYQISHWADLINAHPVPGPGMISGLKEVAAGSACKGCLLVAEMSSEGSLATGEYTQKTITMAKDFPDFIIGFISQSRLTDDPQIIHMSPGVKLEMEGGTLGQQYNTPEEVITHQGSDIIIVGNGIYAAPDPVYTAKLFQEAGYSAYTALFD